MWAVSRGHAGTVRELVSLLPVETITLLNKAGISAPTMAASNGRDDIVESLNIQRYVGPTIRRGVAIARKRS